MATVTITKALTNYFNAGAGKVESKVWIAELRALTAEEKVELATLITEETGDKLSLPAPKTD